MTDNTNIKFILLLIVVVFVYLVGFGFDIPAAYAAFSSSIIEILKFIGVK
jgi:hypothetical protein